MNGQGMPAGRGFVKRYLIEARGLDSLVASDLCDKHEQLILDAIRKQESAESVGEKIAQAEGLR